VAGWCTGLIKFKLTDTGVAGNTGKNTESVIGGQLEAVVLAALLQIFHMHQKTGRSFWSLKTGQPG